MRLTLFQGTPIVSSAEELAHFHANTNHAQAWIRVSEPLLSACLLLERARDVESPLGELSRAILMQLEGFSRGDAMPTVLGWLEQAGAMQELLLASSPVGSEGSAAAGQAGMASAHGTSGHGTSGHGTSGHGTSGHGTSGHGTSGHGTSARAESAPDATPEPVPPRPFRAAAAEAYLSPKGAKKPGCFYLELETEEE